MIQIPKLSFLPPEVFGQAMLVDEIDFVKAVIPNPVFKGARFVVYPGQTSPLDIHEVRECWFIASGNGTIYYKDDQESAVTQGDILYFDSNHSHKIFNNGTSDLLIFSVWWK